ncbi:hypothetical protein A2617_00775 [Candidatus Daviesbacteria bacterium RIFOXYD1_FULL_41_10]|uniref:ATP synthase F1 complex delta/epsilon subunit N-terminal domain-containing protein n=2 Tax=Microgenomates group TaxID=1794810 RepID=A0A1F5N253_9BACT|nr:MAG: hypothetical protein UU34_C0007G0019 [Candidatus Curtissbacteria bacterium GW2011_GWA1_41_11]OGE71739.1 MAG: hypothetical protein A2617_00775 [Candidatus Daviesbacteria bacterium RIFOXYD1_FULL_41_10]
MTDENSPLLLVKIISPKETIFDGQATSVSSTNFLGKFDILPEHANFITMVKSVPIEVRVPGEKGPRSFTFPLAIIYNIKNKVSIFTDIQGNLY